ncbi:FecR domain-containing protein [Peredibacter sp. HCB2-198]|uniref:FecR domain-containing protein n=1 Tax=Peredibacter sp. HCB2-198 TaxID=3383025 RepID=UPI0038B6B19F
MKFLLLLLGLVSFDLFASAKVLVLKGKATFGGHPLKSTSLLKGAGEFVVSDKSYLKILLEESQTTIVLAANTTSYMSLNDKVTIPELSLLHGAARWITGTSKVKKGGGIQTKNAAMGLRGTNFFVSYNPLLGETEVICFDGSVEMKAKLVKSEPKLIGKNQWGGIGGRFGEELSKVLSLSPELVKQFNSALPE